MLKNFKGWMKLKAKLHYGGSKPKISDGDIWWALWVFRLHLKKKLVLGI